ncbi:hypothetical protein [Dyadobacter sp. NIV53]|uniref:hypothetical protein n=1 Tax=Dyadobacter sp. NIV53 TaxID=2861765 RepID=UPI001C86DCBE|nr:hypothetical protein [Dyadobacter sp. NIV53]
MNLPGIKTEYTTKGRVKRVVIDGSTKSELVEDLLDIIAYEEAKQTDTGERYSWDDLKAELDKKHEIGK